MTGKDGALKHQKELELDLVVNATQAGVEH